MIELNHTQFTLLGVERGARGGGVPCRSCIHPGRFSRRRADRPGVSNIQSFAIACHALQLSAFSAGAAAAVLSPHTAAQLRHVAARHGIASYQRIYPHSGDVVHVRVLDLDVQLASTSSVMLDALVAAGV